MFISVTVSIYAQADIRFTLHWPGTQFTQACVTVIRPVINRGVCKGPCFIGDVAWNVTSVSIGSMI
jgi:hypothetical protein